MPLLAYFCNTISLKRSTWGSNWWSFDQNSGEKGLCSRANGQGCALIHCSDLPENQNSIPKPGQIKKQTTSKLPPNLWKKTNRKQKKHRKTMPKKIGLFQKSALYPSQKKRPKLPPKKTACFSSVISSTLLPLTPSEVLPPAISTSLPKGAASKARRNLAGEAWEVFSSGGWWKCWNVWTFCWKILETHYMIKL